MSTPAFPFLLLPQFWSSANRARRRERGDFMRAGLFGLVAVIVCGAMFWGAFWLTVQVSSYEEFGNYLLRLGLSWLFLAFLAFLAFSGVVTSLSTFFLADDLRLLMTAPVAARRLFMARFTRTVAQSSWMVVIFVTPVLLGVGAARCAPPGYYVTAALTVVPFSIIPVAVGSAATLLLVNVFPARRARDLLMLVSLLFAAALVLLSWWVQHLRRRWRKEETAELQRRKQAGLPFDDFDDVESLELLETVELPNVQHSIRGRRRVAPPPDDGGPPAPGDPADKA